MSIATLVDDLKHVNILIVEDGQDIRDIMSSTFNKLFKTTRTAVDGIDGIEKYKEMEPDLIITDIRMPRMSGNEMIDEIRKLNSNIPIIIVSGHSNMIKIPNQANCSFEKPIKFDKLVEAIHKLTR